MKKLSVLIFAVGTAAIAPALHAQTCAAGQINPNYGPAGSNGAPQVSPLYVTGNSGGNYGYEGFALDSVDNAYIPVVTGGTSTASTAGVVRVSKGGVIDRSYGGFGFVVPANQPDNSAVNVTTSLAVDSQDRMIYAEASDSQLLVARFLSSGVPDATFATTGTAAVPIGNLYNGIIGVAAQVDGKIVVVSGANNQGSPGQQALAVRFNNDGTLDTGFGTNGFSFILPAGFSGNARATDVAVLGDGHIVLAGRVITSSPTSFIASPFVARLLANGAPDTTFGAGGISVINFPGLAVVGRKLAVQTDGKVVVAGSVELTSGDTELALLRVNTDGSLDTAFGSNGQVVSRAGLSGLGIALQDNGRILAAGGDTVSSAMYVARYTTKGLIDTTFGTSGVAEVLPAGIATSSTAAVHVSSTGKIFSYASFGAAAGGYNVAVSLCH